VINQETAPRLPLFGRLGAVALWGLFIGGGMLTWQAGRWVEQEAFDDLQTQGEQELALYVSYLDNQLERFAYLPELLSGEPRLLRALTHGDDPALVEEANRYLSRVKHIVGALDVYLMNRNGLTIAASNWLDERTFVGRNFAFRPYFEQALEGRLGRYFALGTTSHVRGYYFAYPLRLQREVLGVVVVKIDVDTLEQAWRSRYSEVLVTDPDQVVFIATRPEWRYRILGKIPAVQRQRIVESRRYPADDLLPMRFEVVRELASESRLVRLGDDRERFLAVEESMPLAGWHVRLLGRSQGVAEQVLQARLLVGILIALAMLSLVLVLQRRRRHLERALHADEKRTAMEASLVELEARVAQRTADLTTTNRRLQREVERHEQTREELIQAAKLAALGQMAAGINHELNQPLAAMRAYADNARTFLERGRVAEAEHNLGLIAELTERMAQTSSQLKVFSRRASGERVRVSINACVEGALKILRPRFRQTGVELLTDMSDDDIYVLGDMVQLEQVMVNLLSNALDAVANCDVRQIGLSVSMLGHDQVRILVRDTGPGIPARDLGRIFDPFFTTSESGLGLGLSISSTIVERLQGKLTASNHSDGGAVFQLLLDAPRSIDDVASSG
jgi:two-component system C4-dicarboxylate transport sensor histidine kinase DctB